MRTGKTLALKLLMLEEKLKEEEKKTNDMIEKHDNLAEAYLELKANFLCFQDTYNQLVRHLDNVIKAETKKKTTAKKKPAVKKTNKKKEKK